MIDYSTKLKTFVGKIYDILNECYLGTFRKKEQNKTKIAMLYTKLLRLIDVREVQI